MGSSLTPNGRTLKLTSGGFVFLRVNPLLKEFNPLLTLGGQGGVLMRWNYTEPLIICCTFEI